MVLELTSSTNKIGHRYWARSVWAGVYGARGGGLAQKNGGAGGESAIGASQSSGILHIEQKQALSSSLSIGVASLGVAWIAIAKLFQWVGQLGWQIVNFPTALVAIAFATPKALSRSNAGRAATPQGGPVASSYCRLPRRRSAQKARLFAPELSLKAQQLVKKTKFQPKTIGVGGGQTPLANSFRRVKSLFLCVKTSLVGKKTVWELASRSHLLCGKVAKLCGERVCVK